MVIYEKSDKNKGVEHAITKDYDGMFARVESRLSKLKHINLDNFYANAASLEVNEVSAKNIPIRGAMATYDSRYNRLRYLKEDYQVAIDHELLHMASSVATPYAIYCGLSQKDLQTGGIIGSGLTEGYTVLLDQRYFPDIKDKEGVFKRIYTLPQEFAKNVEELVGQENMEKWYFDGDLYSLVEYLQYYMPIERVADFLNDIDIMARHTIRPIGPLSYFIMGKAYEDAVSFITESCIYSLYLNREEETITDEELKSGLERIKEYATSARLAFGKSKVIKSRPMSNEKFAKLLKKNEEDAKVNAIK